MNPESALPGFRVDRGTTLAQRQPPKSPPVTPESPALDVVTELTQVKAATAPASSALAQCEQAMITQGVRMLLVTTELPAIDGVVTTTDLPASARCASWRGIVSRAQIERQLPRSS
jgi:predicted transcriptional regulator